MLICDTSQLNERSLAEVHIRNHWRLIHEPRYGVLELRAFEPDPMVAYVDNDEDFVRCVFEVEGKVAGTYVGVQPRPPHLFDHAANRWKRGQAKPHQNCACDADIEFLANIYIDIDVESPGRCVGHPASDEELEKTLACARVICRKEALGPSGTIGCSGNGHCIIIPMAPIPVNCREVARQFRAFGQEIINRYQDNVPGTRLDHVFNLSRVMRVMGSINGKGQPVAGRPHRRAYFVTEPRFTRSEALHYMITSTEVSAPSSGTRMRSGNIGCNLSKIQTCEFIKWCQEYPQLVSEPLWFAMITNLAPLEGGPELIHRVSSGDKLRYDFEATEKVIRRVLAEGYRPARCSSFCQAAPASGEKGKFYCRRRGTCPAKAPMFLSSKHKVYA